MLSKKENSNVEWKVVSYVRNNNKKRISSNHATQKEEKASTK